MSVIAEGRSAWCSRSRWFRSSSATLIVLVALGLLFDTLIVRSFMTPSIAALPGRWFWWPVQVQQRAVPQKFASADSGSCRCASYLRLPRPGDPPPTTCRTPPRGDAR